MHQANVATILHDSRLQIFLPALKNSFPYVYIFSYWRKESLETSEFYIILTDNYIISTEFYIILSEN